MHKWLNKESLLFDSIETLYIISTLQNKDFINVDKPEVNKQVTFIISSNNEVSNPSDYRYIISKEKLINISAMRIFLIPHSGELWYMYHRPFYLDIQVSQYAKPIIDDTYYTFFKSTNLFSYLIELMSISNIRDIDIAWNILNYDRIFLKINLPFYEAKNITSTSVDIYRNGKHYATTCNWFKTDNVKLFEMLLVANYYSDGIPYLQNYNQDIMFTRSGIFRSNITTPLFETEHKNPIRISNSTVSTIPSIMFTPFGNYILTYIPFLDYITIRKVRVFGSMNITLTSVYDITFNKTRNKLSSSEISRVYEHFKLTELFIHRFMNYLNFADVEYEKYGRSASKDNTINDVVKKIFSVKGMNWGMEKTIYKMIASKYTRVLECFATKYNHFLDDYCDPLTKSFFELKQIDLKDFDCLIVNPPFTEILISKSINYCYYLLHQKESLIIYFFMPLWHDYQYHLNLLCLTYIKIIPLPESYGYNFEIKTHKNISTQLVIMSNYILSENQENITIEIINKCLRN